MTQRDEFSRVRQDGRAKTGRFVILSTLADPGLPFLKVGFITTRKVGKAHDRNLLRRRLRAIVQRHGGALADSRRFLVTIPRRGAVEASFEELERDWLQQASRLKILHREEQG